MVEELTIKELKYKIKDLEDDLDLYLTLKKINFQKTQPGCSKPKDIVTSKPIIFFDKFSHYVIKDEDYDDTIYLKTEQLLAYQKRLLQKIENVRKGDEIALITYLRDEKKWSWNRIDRYLHRGEDYSRTKMKRYKNLTKNEIDPL